MSENNKDKKSQNGSNDFAEVKKTAAQAGKSVLGWVTGSLRVGCGVIALLFGVLFFGVFGAFGVNPINILLPVAVIATAFLLYSRFSKGKGKEQETGKAAETETPKTQKPGFFHHLENIFKDIWWFLKNLGRHKWHWSDWEPRTRHQIKVEVNDEDGRPLDAELVDETSEEEVSSWGYMGKRLAVLLVLVLVWWLVPVEVKDHLDSLERREKAELSLATTKNHKAAAQAEWKARFVETHVRLDVKKTKLLKPASKADPAGKTSSDPYTKHTVRKGQRLQVLEPRTKLEFGYCQKYEPHPQEGQESEPFVLVRLKDEHNNYLEATSPEGCLAARKLWLFNQEEYPKDSTWTWKWAKDTGQQYIPEEIN